MIVKKLIEKIEGEAELDFTFKNGKIEDVHIGFGFYRGIEEILVGKVPEDALVITPRVCGICNHAHLLAAVRAIENGYQSQGISVQLTSKAEKIREFTLACEVIQNHIKWFYLVILPQLEHMMVTQSGENYALKVSYLSSTITKALAVFAGQWPHSSYAIPGGISCDPTYVDVMQAEGFVDEAIRFFEQVMIGIPFSNYLEIESVSSLSKINGDLRKLIDGLEVCGMLSTGQSYDRFIVFGKDMGRPSGKLIATSVANADIRYVEESEQKDTVAKAVAYKNRLYEVGPLARGMVAKTPIVRSLHKRYKDSLYTRIFARVNEIAQLLGYCKELLNSLSLDEPSCVLEVNKIHGSFEGVGIVEASRGSLIHKTTVEKGKIVNYEIITPTQWNLSHGTSQEKGIAIRAMVGSKSIEEATFIFRTFDVCSVCTAQ